MSDRRCNSYPNAFKSMYYVERENWDADIKVDIDDHRNPLRTANLREAAAWLKKRDYRVTRVMGLKTRRGLHIRLWMFGTGFAEMPPYTVLRVQAMMGDDPMRSRFNRRRVVRHEQGWNVLWNQKWRNGKLVSEEVFDVELTKKLERIFQ